MSIKMSEECVVKVGITPEEAMPRVKGGGFRCVGCGRRDVAPCYYGEEDFPYCFDCYMGSPFLKVRRGMMCGCNQ